MSSMHVLVCLSMCLLGASAQLYDGMFRKLMRGYAKDVMPRRNINATVGVKFNLQLIQIQDLHINNQLLRSEVWISMQWRDRRLAWNPADYGDADKIAIPPNKLWVPDIVLYNGVLATRGNDIRAVVYHDGTVYLIRPAILRSRCDVALSAGDTSTCTLKFGSWVHSGNELDLDFQTDAKEFDMSDYVASYDYEVVDNSAKRNLIFYDCCEEPYVDLTYTIHINRAARRRRR